jgi:hypothetical protein
MPWPRPARPLAALLALALCAGAGPAAGAMATPAPALDATLAAAAPAAPAASPFALARPGTSFTAGVTGEEPDGPLAFSFGRRQPRAPRAPAQPEVLGGERARILLRSLTLPGWGQATLGRRTSAIAFGLTEAAIWGTFTAFRIQVAMREDAYLRTARLLAGIDLGDRDEEWRRIVGSFQSSDEYNRLVVARDAANLYYSDPVAYRAYLDEHSLKGADTWNWASPGDQERYRNLRRYAQRAARRANSTLAVAVANRIISALHAARVAGHPTPARSSWQLEVVPVEGRDATAFQFRVHARF